MNRRIMSCIVGCCLAWLGFATGRPRGGRFRHPRRGERFLDQQPRRARLQGTDQAPEGPHVSRRRFHAHRRLGRPVGGQRLLHQQRQPACLQEARRTAKGEEHLQVRRVRPCRRLDRALESKRKLDSRQVSRTMRSRRCRKSSRAGARSGRSPSVPTALGSCCSTRPASATETSPTTCAMFSTTPSRKGLAVRCVCFTTSGTWICLTDNGWWTSDLNHPASKMIAALDKQHRSLRWVAVAPEIGPHDFNKWAAVIHRQCDGKLPGGYAFEVLHEGKVVAKGAEGWARAPGRRTTRA